MNFEAFSGSVNPFFFGAFVIWLMFWKCLALWRAAKGNQAIWFVLLLILNSLTFGVLEIIFLFKFAKKPLTIEDIKNKNFLPK